MTQTICIHMIPQDNSKFHCEVCGLTMWPVITVQRSTRFFNVARQAILEALGNNYIPDTLDRSDLTRTLFDLDEILEEWEDSL
jgi:hypothetical protein